MKAGRWWMVGCAVTATVVLLLTGFGSPDGQDVFLKVNRNIDLFGRVYREITLNYVDEVDPERFMEAGIEGMLETLDPYTTYIDREEWDEVELITTGKYGGIGVTIGQREGAIQVISVMEGYAAQRQGIQPGDRILEVDGVPVSAKNPDEVRSLTRGEPGTEVRVTVDREGEAEPLAFVLMRQEIQIRNVTYSGFLEPGIGYIRLERFSRTAGEEVRTALRELKLSGEVRGLVLDLRGNPGGLLDAAVDVASKFVPRGSLVVTTRGRRADAAKSYPSVEEPVLPEAPLVVLTDRNSASASEIVSGAVQDLDRGLIVGLRTFGKGLVQTIVPLTSGAQLKITTARYYTPSGRSIQEINYDNRDRNGVFVAYPDSTRKEFLTAAGRKVYEHGGVSPDSVVDDPDAGPMVRQLLRRGLFFKFVTTYLVSHRREGITGVTDEIMAAFRAYIDEQKFTYQEETEESVRDLQKLAEDLHYTDAVKKDLRQLEEDLAAEKRRGFERYRNHIRYELGMELMARVRGEQGRIEASLQDDVVLRTGVSLLRDRNAYARKIRG
jgi:carboxyl-terminal processing protease